MNGQTASNPCSDYSRVDRIDKRVTTGPNGGGGGTLRCLLGNDDGRFGRQGPRVSAETALEMLDLPLCRFYMSAPDRDCVLKRAPAFDELGVRRYRYRPHVVVKR